MKTNIAYDMASNDYTRNYNVDNELEKIDTARGVVRFNKRFFATCASLGGVATLIGTTCLVVAGVATAPVVATGLGVASLVTGTSFYQVEKRQERQLHEKEKVLMTNYNRMR